MINLFRRNIVLKQILALLSIIYRILTDIRNFLFDKGLLKSQRFDVPVISVGNITSGGTGKTPFTMSLIDLLKNDFSRITVISRGYKRKSKGLVVVSDGKGDIASVEIGGDEPALIAKKFPKCPVIVSEKRSVAIDKAINAFNADLIILDDAFQHRWVSRDCDIILIKSQTDIKKERLLPLGNLRESVKNLNRGNIIIVTDHTSDVNNCDQKYLKDNFSGHIFLSNTLPDCLVDINLLIHLNLLQIRSHPVIAFAGIANPTSFEKILFENKIIVKKFIAFHDHQVYSDKDIKRLICCARQNDCQYIITTEKDIVKFKKSDFEDLKLLGLSIKIEIKNVQNLRQKILSHIDMK